MKEAEADDRVERPDGIGQVFNILLFDRAVNLILGHGLLSDGDHRIGKISS